MPCNNNRDHLTSLVRYRLPIKTSEAWASTRKTVQLLLNMRSKTTKATPDRLPKVTKPSLRTISKKDLILNNLPHRKEAIQIRRNPQNNNTLNLVHHQVAMVRKIRTLRALLSLPMTTNLLNRWSSSSKSCQKMLLNKPNWRFFLAMWRGWPQPRQVLATYRKSWQNRIRHSLNSYSTKWIENSLKLWSTNMGTTSSRSYFPTARQSSVS